MSRDHTSAPEDALDMAETSINVTGPNRAGEFVGTLSNGETSLLLCWEDLEALKEFWQTDQVCGDLMNLSRRTRSV
jgi:hypothetical protein